MNARILVVEDDAQVARMVKQVLERAGYEVFLAEDGIDALAALARLESCDLVITDLDLPRVTGDALIRALALDHRWHAIPVMQLTASPQRADPALPVLEKPFRMATLLAVVEDCLRRSRASHPFKSEVG